MKKIIYYAIFELKDGFYEKVMGKMRNKNKMLSTAILMAARVYEQVLTDDGMPYILSQLKQMFSLYRDDPEKLSAFILKDLPYVSDWTLEKIREEGFSDFVVQAIEEYQSDHIFNMERYERLKAQSASVDGYGLVLGTAIRVASEAHHKILDKGGSAYILHPIRVMLRLRSEDPEIMGIAVSHDVLEDSKDHEEGDLRREGYTERMVIALKLLDHRDGSTYPVYIERMRDNLDAILVKMEDLRDNSDITRLKGVRDKDIERVIKYHTSYLYLKERKAVLLDIDAQEPRKRFRLKRA